MKCLLGIDPGSQGGFATISEDRSIIHTVSFSNLTETDINAQAIKHFANVEHCWLEKVHSRPGQGVKSTFTFGKNYGFIRGLLIAHHIPFEDVMPQVWQRKVGFVPPRGASKDDHKKALKGYAQQLFPRCVLTLATCDALLIAEYGWRMRYGAPSITRSFVDSL